VTETPPRAAGAWLLVTAFLSGLSVMVLEMAAVRAIAPYFGQSSLIWTYVIGVILAALSAGYYLGGRLADRHPRSSVLFTVLLVGGLLCMLLPLLVRLVCRGLMPADLVVEGGEVVLRWASLAATLILFAPPVFVLGAVSPTCVRLLATEEHVGREAGRVFALGTVGSILPTFLTTLIFIPELGTRLTIGLAGAVLVATAVVGFLLNVGSRRGALGGGTAGALLLAVLVFGLGPIKAHADQVEERESRYQYVRVLDRKESEDTEVRLLQFNESETTYQSVQVPGTVLTGGRYYDYYSVLPLLLEGRARKDLEVLVLGLAAGTIPAQLRHFYPQGLTVTGVEIDPEVVELGRKHFGMPAESDWLRVVKMDGRAYLNSIERDRSFDLIVIDAFAKEYYIPFHLATVEAFRTARERLAPGGILAMNVSAYRSDARLLRAIESTLAEAFGKAYRVKVRGYANYMVFAVKDGDAAVGALLALPADRPEEGWEKIRGIARHVATSTTTIEPPEDDALVLTDDRAPVENLTDASIHAESKAMLGD